MPKSLRSKACDIPRKVKIAVGDRDRYTCVLCKRPGIPDAHYVPRSAGGLGIEENVVCLCPACHKDYDNGYHRELNLRSLLGERISHYLRSIYPNWDRENLIYRKEDY